jgi:hypothetical protein
MKQPIHKYMIHHDSFMCLCGTYVNHFTELKCGCLVISIFMYVSRVMAPVKHKNKPESAFSIPSWGNLSGKHSTALVGQV